LADVGRVNPAVVVVVVAEFASDNVRDAPPGIETGECVATEASRHCDVALTTSTKQLAGSFANAEIDGRWVVLLPTRTISAPLKKVANTTQLKPVMTLWVRLALAAATTDTAKSEGRTLAVMWATARWSFCERSSWLDVGIEDLFVV
jgi:hypothetical protein